jgi:hypothetical protein
MRLGRGVAGSRAAVFELRIPISPKRRTFPAVSLLIPQHGGGTMKTVAVTLALVLGASGLASAQDDRDRKLDELKREFDRTMKGLQQKYEAQRAEMEQMFKAQMERLKKGEHREDEKKPRSTEELLKSVLERLDRLEKRLDQELPRIVPFEHLPKFDFKRFDDFKEFAPYWREFIPKFKDDHEHFRFEFKKKGGDDDDDDKKSEKKEEKKDEKKEKGKKEKMEKKDDEKKKF